MAADATAGIAAAALAGKISVFDARRVRRIHRLQDELYAMGFPRRDQLKLVFRWGAKTYTVEEALAKGLATQEEIDERLQEYRDAGWPV